jgi:hypothetical protein
MALWWCYKGTSKFDVLILGQNAVEINYDQSVEVEILDEWPNHKTKKRLPLVSPRPLKKVRGINFIMFLLLSYILWLM